MNQEGARTFTCIPMSGNQIASVRLCRGPQVRIELVDQISAHPECVEQEYVFLLYRRLTGVIRSPFACHNYCDALELARHLLPSYRLYRPWDRH